MQLNGNNVKRAHNVHLILGWVHHYVLIYCTRCSRECSIAICYKVVTYATRNTYAMRGGSNKHSFNGKPKNP